MLVRDIVKKKSLKTYVVKLKLQQKGSPMIMDTTVQARNPQMARIIVKQQYGSGHVMIGQPRELK